jgi:site-specific DNA-methyltransferase (adenine-specific)
MSHLLKKYRGKINLIYIDPPFNTGHTQKLASIKTTKDKNGDRIGFQGTKYKTTKLSEESYFDAFEDYRAFLIPRLEQAYRALKDIGVLIQNKEAEELLLSHNAKC